MGLDHHTKGKGDYAVLRAAADLGGFGALVCNPLTEHAPFDLVAYCRDEFFRVQVKYRTAVDGALEVRLRSTWSDRNGLHISRAAATEVDWVAVYEPGMDRCLWLTPDEVGTSVRLRTRPARNNQTVGIRMAADYLGIERLFGTAD